MYIAGYDVHELPGMPLNLFYARLKPFVRKKICKSCILQNNCNEMCKKFEYYLDKTLNRCMIRVKKETAKRKSLEPQL